MVSNKNYRTCLPTFEQSKNDLRFDGSATPDSGRQGAQRSRVGKIPDPVRSGPFTCRSIVFNKPGGRGNPRPGFVRNTDELDILGDPVIIYGQIGHAISGPADVVLITTDDLPSSPGSATGWQRAAVFLVMRRRELSMRWRIFTATELFRRQFAPPKPGDRQFT